MENAIISAAPRHLRGQDDGLRCAGSAGRGKLFRSLADDGVNVDMIVQNVSDATDISFTCRTTRWPATTTVGALVAEIGAKGV